MLLNLGKTFSHGLGYVFLLGRLLKILEVSLKRKKQRVTNGYPYIFIPNFLCLSLSGLFGLAVCSTLASAKANTFKFGN